MKKIQQIFCVIGVALLMTACGPESPTEAEVCANIIGSYCSGDYKLEITETEYKSAKISFGAISNTPIRESCKGTYALAFEKGVWIIRFAKDDNPKGIKNCKGEYQIWNTIDGYGVGEDEVSMRELIDNTEVTKAGCEE